MRRDASSRGFTLVEVLVVLVIMGLFATVATLSLDRVSTRNSEEELERLRRVLELASERANVRGRPIAVDFLPTGYRFSVLETSGEWRLLFTPASLAERPWRRGLSVDGLEIAGQAVQEPLRLIFMSHESPEFRLRVSTPEGGHVLTGHLSGAVTLARANTALPGMTGS